MSADQDDPKPTTREQVILGLVRGLKHASIAKQAGVSRQRVQTLATAPDVVAEVERLRKERRDRICKRLDFAADRALETLIANLRDEDARVRNDAAKQILDRAGVVATQKIEVSTTGPADPVAKIAAVLARAGARGGGDAAPLDESNREQGDDDADEA